MAIPEDRILRGEPNSSAKNKNPYEASRASVAHNDRVFNDAALGGKNGNEFNVFRYPVDLGDVHHPHYVMFFINIRKSDVSEYERGKISNVQIDQSASLRPTAEDAKGVAVWAGAVGGSAVAQEITRLPVISGGINVVQGLAGFLVDTRRLAEGVTSIGGGLVGGAVASGLAEGRTQVLLKDAIALYIPQPPNTAYGASWMEDELGAAAGLAGPISDLLATAGDSASGVIDAAMSGNPLEALKAVGRGTKNIAEGVKNMVGGLGQAGSAAILKGSEAMRGSVLGNVGGVLQSGAAIVPNPFRAQLFKVMGFRKFGFSYTFLPQSLEEYQQVKKIIETFKRYMHPSIGANKFILNYPAEFNIVYYYQGRTNEELFKISNCALTDLNVSYGGADFLTFKGTAGAPSEIHLKLQFTELEMLTRERVAAGF